MTQVFNSLTCNLFLITIVTLDKFLLKPFCFTYFLNGRVMVYLSNPGPVICILCTPLHLSVSVYGTKSHMNQ